MKRHIEYQQWDDLNITIYTYWQCDELIGSYRIEQHIDYKELCGLYIQPTQRGKGYANQLLEDITNFKTYTLVQMKITLYLKNILKLVLNI